MYLVKAVDRAQYNLGLILFTICFLNLNILGFTQTSTPTPVNTSTSTPTNTATSTPFATFTSIPTPTGSTYNLSAFNYATGGFKPINSDETGLISGNLNVDGIITGDGSGITSLENIDKLQIGQAYRVLEVSTDGNNTTASTGVGPFSTLSAAYSYASVYMSPSVASPVVILIHPGTYTYTGYNYFQNGIYFRGIDRDSVILENHTFSCTTDVDSAGLSDLTLHRTAAATQNSMFYSTVAGKNISVVFDNVRFFSESPYEEATGNVSMSLFTGFNNGSTAQILMKNCSVDIQHMLFFMGHPINGDRDCVIDATLENCYIRSAPTGDGPDDPHFLINWWQPGTLTIKNSYLLYDLDNFTDSNNLHGLILMQNEDGNDYPSDGMQALNIYNSKLELRDNGLSSGYTIPIIQVNATSGKNRCTTTLEDVTIIRDADVDCDLFTSNQSTVYYRGTNLIDWTDSGGAATVTILSDGNKTFENVTIDGTLGVSGALTASGTGAFGGNVTIGANDSTDDILTLGGGYWKWDETYSQLVTASPVYMASSLSIAGHLTLASNKQVKQAQNGDTGPFMVSGMLGDPVSPSPPSFDTSVLGYSPGPGTTTSLFKLREIPVTVHNSTVYIDAVNVICEGADAAGYMDQVRILTYDDYTGYTVISTYTTDFGVGGKESDNVISADISRATHQGSLYIEFTMVKDFAFYLYDVVIQYHLE